MEISNTGLVNAQHALNFPIETLRLAFATMSAADVAELFLSPHIHPTLLVDATVDEGPSMWIVNRSDVYDQTLQGLSSHSVTSISDRAKEKLSLRKSKLIFLTPPELPPNLEETPDYMIEDLLGHPLVPLQIPLHFSTHLIEDFRSSAALSLTRRLLEHEPNWAFDLALKNTIVENFFELLIQDSSPFVRSYVARIPLFSSAQILEAFVREKNNFVRGRLLQNPASTPDMVNRDFDMSADNPRELIFLNRVAALDSRVSPDLRKKFTAQQFDESADPVCIAAHTWYLKNS